MEIESNLLGLYCEYSRHRFRVKKKNRTSQRGASSNTMKTALKKTC